MMKSKLTMITALVFASSLSTVAAQVEQKPTFQTGEFMAKEIAPAILRSLLAGGAVYGVNHHLLEQDQTASAIQAAAVTAFFAVVRTIVALKNRENYYDVAEEVATESTEETTES